MRACAEHHLRPLVARLRPEIVIGMGAQGWKATRIALGLLDVPTAIATAAGGLWTTSETSVGAVGHCGPLGLANRPWARQIEDWRRIGLALGNPVPDLPGV